MLLFGFWVRRSLQADYELWEARAESFHNYVSEAFTFLGNC